MNSLLGEILKPLLVVGLAAVLAHCTGCTPVGQPRLPNRQEVYTGEITACSGLSKSKAEAVECRRAVNRKYDLCGPGSTLQPC